MSIVEFIEDDKLLNDVDEDKTGSLNGFAQALEADKFNNDLDDEVSELFISENTSNTSLLNRMSPCEDDMLADGSSCVIIDGKLLASVDGVLVANVDDTLLLPEVDGTPEADIS